MRAGTPCLYAIEEPGELDGTCSVDVVHTREIKFDSAAAGERRFDVRDLLRGGHGVREIERTGEDQTGAVAFAIGVNHNLHRLDPPAFSGLEPGTCLAHSIVPCGASQHGPKQPPCPGPQPGFAENSSAAHDISGALRPTGGFSTTRRRYGSQEADGCHPRLCGPADTGPRPGNWRPDGPRYFGRPPSDGVSRPAVRAQIVNESGRYLLSPRRHVACSDNLWPADVIP